MRTLRMTLVLLLATSILVVIPGEVDATPPGEIGRIAFISTRDEIAGEIYVRDFAGSQAIRLTTNTAEDVLPRWSPDGDRLAFSQLLGDWDVHVINDDGSNEINLTNDVFYDDLLMDWSPDGSRLLFASDRGGTMDLWTMHPDGTSAQRLTDNSDEEFDADFSPDGSTIAFCTRAGGSFDYYIWLIDADGSNPRRLDATKEGCDPTWSPDGIQIAYHAPAGANVDVFIVNADGSNPVNLTNNPAVYYHKPAWSPDGSRIAFERLDTDWELFMINPDGTGLAPLAVSPTTFEFDVDWESANRAPVAVDDGDAVVHRGQSVEIDPLRNDSDPDGDALTLGEITRMPEEGSVIINPAGTVTYTHNGMTVPPDHVMPYTDSFDYRVDDARMGSAFATVQVWIYPYFDDVPESNVFFDDVLWLGVQRITQGCNPPDNTLFCPAEFVTRGQMAAFLVRARGYTDVGEGNLFVDDDGSVFELDIDKLGTAGVTRGCNPPVNDRYCPNGLVTRGQMAAFLSRAFSLTDQGTHDLFIDDDGSIFEDDIDKLGATGVSRGCNPPLNDHFCPDQYVTREQMAAFISRAVNWGEE